MFPTIQIGPLAIRSSEMIIILGLWVGLLISEKLAQHYKSKTDILYNLVFITLFSGILGARVSYILTHIEVFIESPINIFSLNSGLMDPIGGAAIGFFSTIIYANRKQISIWLILDDLTPLFIVIMKSNSLSQFASGKAYGIETALPWGINLWGKNRHPTQIYDFFLSAIVMGIILIMIKTRPNGARIPGYLFLVSTSLIATSKLFLEAFRGSTGVILFNVRVNQVISWLVLAVSLRSLITLHKKSNMKNEVKKWTN
jgi:phosphatidylglycerol:prolipoprotein diacylglycerol transferase